MSEEQGTKGPWNGTKDSGNSGGREDRMRIALMVCITARILPSTGTNGA